MTISKMCNRCKSTQPLSSFRNNPDSPDGLYSLCRACEKKRVDRYARQHQAERSAYQHQHYTENKDRILEYGRKHYYNHRTRVLERQKSRKEQMKEHLASVSTAWNTHNQTRISNSAWRSSMQTKLQAGGSTKICWVCGTVRCITDFNFSSRSKDRTRPECKHCRSQREQKPNAQQAMKASRPRRKARKKSLPHTLTTADIQQIMQYWDNTCAYANADCHGDLTIDHVIPLARGGGTTAFNCVPCCRRHNCMKQDRTPWEAGLKFTKPPIQQLSLL